MVSGGAKTNRDDSILRRNPLARADTGWTDSALELAKIRLLDKVQEENEKGFAPVDGQFVGIVSHDERLLKTAARALGDEGLAHTEAGLSPEISLQATAAGEALVQTRKERRGNRKLRPAAARDALLDWCYQVGEVANIGNFPSAVQAHFEGDPFSEDEINQASRDLEEKGFITGSGSAGGGIARPSLTAAGRSVIEDYDSSIRAYETRDQTPRGHATTINFDASTFSGQLTVGDYNQVTQNTGSVDQEFSELVKAVLDSASGTSEEDRVAKIVAQLQLEADEESPDPTTVSKALQRLQDTAAKTGSSALVLAAGQLAEHTAKMLGWG